jgi:chromosome partitioning protein
VKSVLIANPKGGCGKTTIATNLAAAFANGGLDTALADTDSQRSSLDWLVGRPETAAPILGLDWSKRIKEPPNGISRLVVDSAAAVHKNDLRKLIRTADTVIIPVLPSAFDLSATTAFLKDFTHLKPIRKHKKPFAVVRNRCRMGSRAVKRLDGFMVVTEVADIGWLTDRSLYNEVAWKGLSVFDLHTKQAVEIQQDWIPIVRFVENQGSV